MTAYTQDLVNGVIVADTTTILSEVEGEWTNALGANLNTKSSTAQGKLIAAEATARSGVVRNDAQFANQINPNLAEGIFLDALCALMDIERVGDAKTIFSNVQITGQQGTVISAGSRCRTTSGAVVLLQSQTTIPASGIANVTFVSEDSGSFEAGQINSPWTIIDGVIGWGSAYPTTATVTTSGSVKQSDVALRMQRRRKLGKQGRNSSAAIIADVQALTGVKWLQYRENLSSSGATIDGVVFSEGHSCWVCVDGGSDTEIAKAIIAAKSAGSPTVSGSSNGLVVIVNVTEENSKQVIPVRFTRPELITVYARVTVRQSFTVADPVQSCQDAILSWVAGEQSSEPGLVVGGAFTAFEIAGAINVGVPGMVVMTCEVSTNGTTWSSAIDIKLWQKAVLPRGNIAVNLG